MASTLAYRMRPTSLKDVLGQKHIIGEKAIFSQFVKKKHPIDVYKRQIFIISFALLFYGQKNVGYMGLTLELIGLAGLVLILYIYNKRYK